MTIVKQHNRKTKKGKVTQVRSHSRNESYKDFQTRYKGVPITIRKAKDISKNKVGWGYEIDSSSDVDFNAVVSSGTVWSNKITALNQAKKHLDEVLEYPENNLYDLILKYDSGIDFNELLELKRKGTNSVFISLFNDIPRTKKARDDADEMQRLFMKMK